MKKHSRSKRERADKQGKRRSALPETPAEETAPPEGADSGGKRAHPALEPEHTQADFEPPGIAFFKKFASVSRSVKPTAEASSEAPDAETRETPSVAAPGTSLSTASSRLARPAPASSRKRRSSSEERAVTMEEVPVPTPEDVLQVLRTPLEPLYALLDAARDERVLELLLTEEEKFQSLYEGEQGQELHEVAPYLVRLPPDSALLEALVREGWGQNWGLYLTCDERFADVRQHFRRFLMVKTEDGEQLYFRFYDPRVLRVFLPISTQRQAVRFFGPVQRFFLESGLGDTLLMGACPEVEPSLRDVVRVGTMVISDAQMVTFGQAVEANFIGQLMAHLREHHADVVGRLPDDVLREMVEPAVARARSHGLTWESNIIGFVALMFEIAPNFDQQPTIRRILAEESVPPDERIDLLRDYVSEQDWEEAERLYDENAWFPDLQEDVP